MAKNLISLKVNCPSCEKSLMDYTYFLNAKPSIKLNIAVKDKKGIINLCSTFSCYDSKSNIELIAGEIAELSCPHCKSVLPEADECDTCCAPTAHVNLDKGGKVHVCSRIGCSKHFVTYDDMSSTLSNFYKEYEYGAEDRDF